MPMNRSAQSKRRRAEKPKVRAEADQGSRMLARGEPQDVDVKARQACKIRELAAVLVAAGFVSLDDQAKALGLSRSTTWTILKAKHKNYGLSAALINRVLAKPDLNSRVRSKIIEYIREKAAGSYGHNHTQLRRFIDLLAKARAVSHGELSLVDVNGKHSAPASRAVGRK